MKKTSITCDTCSRDLTTTGNCMDYRIALTNESIPSEGGMVTMMGAYPHLKCDSHFCGVKCLKSFVEKLS